MYESAWRDWSLVRFLLVTQLVSQNLNANSNGSLESREFKRLTLLVKRFRGRDVGAFDTGRDGTVSAEELVAVVRAEIAAAAGSNL